MQHQNTAYYCVGSLNVTVIVMLKGLVLNFSYGNLKRPAKHQLLEKTGILESLSNELDTTCGVRKHLSVFLGEL